MAKRLVVFCMLIYPLVSYSQDQESIHDIDISDPDQQQIENLESTLFNLNSSKIDLNSGDYTNLLDANLITEKQAITFSEHIRNYGPFLSLMELQSISEIDLTTTRKIIPYLYISEEKGFADISKIQQTISLTSTIRNSASDTTEKSSFLLRYRGNAGSSIFWGISAENDALEKFEFRNDKYMFDHITSFIEIRKLGRFNRIIAGDFQAGFGQGLTVWNSYGRSYSTDLLSLKKMTQGIRPNTGRNENNYFRGLATEVSITKHISAIFFASINKIDAVIDTNEITNTKEITSFPNTGYHSKPSEIKSRKSAKITAAGTSVYYKRKQTTIALNSIFTQPEHSVRQKYNFYPKENLNEKKNNAASISYNQSIYNIDVFGEISMTETLTLNYLQGVLISAGPGLSIGIAYNHYSEGYYSMYSNAISTLKKSSNEEALHLSADLRLSRNINLRGYVRTTKTMLPVGSTNSPQNIHEQRLMIIYTPSKFSSIKLSYSGKNQLKNQNVEDYKISIPKEYIHHAGNVSFSNPITPKTLLNLSAQVKRQGYINTMARGFITSISISHVLNERCTLASGVAFSESEKGITMYLTEDRIPGGSSFASMTGSSQRIFVNGSVKLPYRTKASIKATVSKSAGKDVEHSVSVNVSKVFR